MREVCEIQMTEKDYVPIVIGEEVLKSLKLSEVITVDFTKYCRTYPIKYYKVTSEDVGVIVSEKSQKLYFEEEYDFATLKKDGLPFIAKKKEDDWLFN